MLEACNKTVALAEQAWLRVWQGIRGLLIDDVAEQDRHVELQKAIADSLERCSGGRENGIEKMKKKEEFWGREMFL